MSKKQSMKLITLVSFSILLLTSCASSNIGKDKYYHFAAGGASSYVASELEIPEVTSAFVAGFTKETYDYVRYGHFDVKDLVATTLGGVVIKYIIKLIKNEKNNKKIPERHLDLPLVEN